MYFKPTSERDLYGNSPGSARKPLRDGKDRMAGRSRTAPGDDGDELRADGLLEITMFA